MLLNSEISNKIRQLTIVSPDRCSVLSGLASQVEAVAGNFWECGVYKGGTALLLAYIIKQRTLRLFDTFTGMPPTDPSLDWHKAGDFKDTSFEQVSSLFTDNPFVHLYKGTIPETFIGLEEETIALAHIDVDIYKSVMDCCEFIFPRLAVGGVMIFDDYGFETCPGAKRAVDEFFTNCKHHPLVLATKQAVVIKSCV